LEYTLFILLNGRIVVEFCCATIDQQ